MTKPWGGSFQPYLAVVGPTCIGKTAFLAHASTRYPVELINLDSFQVYSHFRIGTGRADLNATHSHLYGFVRPDEVLTPSDYVARVREILPSIQQRRRMPIFEGGSLSYLHALVAECSLRIVGLRPASAAHAADLIEKRLALYSEADLFDEVREALRLGFRDTQVMKDDVVYLPVVEYLDGSLTYEAAFKRIRANLQRRIAEQMQGYKAFDIEWLDLGESASGRLEAVVREMLARQESV